MDNPFALVFDVESIGLHGEGFAVGFVVCDMKTGREVDSGLFAVPSSYAKGTDQNRAWIRANVDPALTADIACKEKDTELSYPRDVRAKFWRVWRGWKALDAVLAADVAWPVEARFLAACVDDSPDDREWDGPYPLIDIASVRAARGFNPLSVEPRREGELPAHHPLADARQSARLLLEAIWAR